MTFAPDTEETPVLFRIKRGRQYAGDGVTAVFPCDPADYSGDLMSCYSHVGQHSGASLGWYRGTKPAPPEEYASLKKELESAPYGYRLKVYSRMHPFMRDARQTGARLLQARS